MRTRKENYKNVIFLIKKIESMCFKIKKKGTSTHHKSEPKTPSTKISLTEFVCVRQVLSNWTFECSHNIISL